MPGRLSGSLGLQIAAPSPVPTLLSPALLFPAYWVVNGLGSFYDLYVFFPYFYDLYVSPSTFGSSFSTTWDMRQIQST